jgi:hypothetical protein
MVKVKVSGTIKLAVLRVDGSIHTLTFSGVFYAPDMFISIISHSKVRPKGCYWHGWEEKLFRAADDLELAYTPDIDGVPNLLQVEDEDDLLGAACAMSFVTQHGSHNRATRLFQRVHVDLVGPKSLPGLNGVGVVVDKHTKISLN